MAESPAQNLRLAIYARVSSDEQREGQNIDSQIAELERFAAERRWPVTDIYKDDGWSGSIMARPELDRLRDDASKGLFQGVLINDVDRLARDVTHLGVVKRDLEKRGVQVIFRKLPAENSPTRNLMVNILGSFAEFERELIMDRTRRGRRHKVETRQQYLGGNTSYGYRYVAKDRGAGKEGILKVNPEEAAVVRQMFAWVAGEGLSARAVMSRLNARAVSPQKGRKWGKSSVLRILHNEMYAGVWHYNKFQGCEPKKANSIVAYRRRTKTSVKARPREEWIALTLPEPLSIVSRDQWKAVQNQLNRNITFSPRNAKHEYLLKGLVRCAGCGHTYVGDPSHGRFGYRCYSRCKKCPSVQEQRIDDAVWNAIREAVLKPALIVNQALKLSESRRAAATSDQNQARQVKEGLTQIAAEEARLLEAYRLCVINPQQLGQQLEILSSRRATLTTQRTDSANNERVSTESEVCNVVQSFCDLAAANIDSFSFAEKQQFLRLIVRKIIFDGQQARIQGCIPLGHEARGLFKGPDVNRPDQTIPLSERFNGGPSNENGVALRSAGSIATMTINPPGRNHAYGRAGGVEIELAASLPPIILTRFVDERGRFCSSRAESQCRQRQLLLKRHPSITEATYDPS